MKRSQLRLLAALAAPLALALLAAGLLLEQRARETVATETARSLAERARLTRELLGERSLSVTERDALDALADRAGEAAGARVTLVAPNGSVVGDSRVPRELLPQLDNHGARPELAEALAGRVGRSTRRSDTVGRAMLYVAVPVDGGEGGAVRVAREPVGMAGGSVWRSLLIAGCLGLLAAAVLAHLLARRMERPLQQLRQLTLAIAAGDHEPRLPRGQPEQLAAVVSSIQDLAEQLRARLAETTKEKERLQAVLDGMTEAVLVVDPEGDIVLANDRLREFFGVEGPLAGRTALEGIRNADLAGLLVDAYENGEPLADLIHVTWPSHRTLRVHAVRFPSGAAEPAGSVAVLHDVTELAQLEKMRREFVANASHELRTPLAAIGGFAETLLNASELAESDRRNYLEVIDRHARRLGNLVSDLLELSRIESGKTELAPGPVDLAALTSGLLGESHERFAARELETSHEVKGEALAWADASAVEQVLTNLLDNAMKYTEPGGRIDVDVRGDERTLHVEVRDTGIGIPEADLARIFERFYRVDKARSRAQGGTGLGLAIVKHLVQSMDGEISVESRVGRGSSFRFTLPRA